MDGGSELSCEFRTLIETDFAVHAVDYPNEPLSIDELAEFVLHQVENLPEPVLIAESFSGPVAIEALRRVDRFVAGVLVCSFVVPPRSSRWRPLLRSPIFKRPPPRWAIRRWMVGADASEHSVGAVHDAIGRVPAAIMAHRARAILAIDSRPALSKLTVPLLAIRARKDRLVDPQSAPEAHAEMVATAEIGGPHLALHCRPEASAAAVRGWLRDLEDS